MFSFSSLLASNEKLIYIGSINKILKFNISSEEIYSNDYIEVINCLSLVEISNNLLATANFSENIYI